MTSNLIPAAEYLRKSTEHQKYSLENQSAAIRDYAECHEFEVVKTYADPARSGLSLKHRPGLQQLLRDVAGGEASYRVILVYDVSRWGRFQDTDEAAHYEFVCKAAGVPVHYCAEAFSNDASLPSSIMKALKRAMAGEYSRELGVKVVEGQKRMAARGFKQGGSPAFGYQRLLVSSDRQPRQLLRRGERKGTTTDRVVLAPGSACDVELVREIFRRFANEGASLRGLARDLNREGDPSPEGKTWHHSVIRNILRSPVYVGCNVFNRRTMRLASASVALPRSEWVVCPGAHEPLVDQETFDRAQRIMGAQTVAKSDEQLLEELRSIVAAKGTLSAELVDEASGMANSRTYWYRFGGLRRAAELIGYDWWGSRRGAANIRILDSLRSILRQEGVLSARIINVSCRDFCSTTVKRRFGSLARAYELVGYEWRENFMRARRWRAPAAS